LGQFDDDGGGCGQLQLIGGRIQPPSTSASSSVASARTVCMFKTSFLFDFFIVFSFSEHDDVQPACRHACLALRALGSRLAPFTDGAPNRRACRASRRAQRAIGAREKDSSCSNHCRWLAG
jgi:hypothetical protein